MDELTKAMQLPQITIQPFPKDFPLEPLTEVDGISYYAALAGIPMDVLYPAKLLAPNSDELQSE